MIARAIAVPLAVLLAACPESEPLPDAIGLGRTTAPPLAATATIVTDDPDGAPDLVEMSVGVAIAARCWDTCDATCVKPTIESADPAVLEVRPVYRQNDTTESDRVLVATGAGTTRLTVRSACTTRVYPVTVLAP